MLCKQLRQHQQRPSRQVYEIWSNQVRRNRPNRVDKIRAEKSTEIPVVQDACWGVAQPR